MSISNRDLDNAGTREVIYSSLPLLATGVTVPIGPIPYPAQIVAASVSANGLSGSPVHALVVSRFIVGSGYTVIGLNATLTIAAYGTSGIQGFSTASFAGATTGSTAAVNLLANDTLLLVTGGANTAALNTGLTVVLRSLQDIKTHFGF